MKLEIKDISEDGSFDGYASTYELDLKGDIIMPGAFKNVKNVSDVFMLFKHRFELPLGKWDLIREEKQGLYVKGRVLRDLYLADEVFQMMREKKICGLSIGFMPIIYERDAMIRKIFEVNLVEISIVKYPANRSALIKKVIN